MDGCRSGHKRSQFCSGEMVMKISAWGYKLSSKALSVNQYTPDMFFKSQWQRNTGISVYYLVYRWLMACILLSILLASLTEMGRPSGDLYHYTKWPIYLTHWGFTMCTLQALLAAYLVTRASCQHPEKETVPMKMNGILRVYWVLHTCATVGAFAITGIYWLFVFNPAENQLDVLNLLVHAGNSILMLTDLIVVSHPIRLVDFYWPMSFSIIYVIFSYTYYFAGGTDRKGNKFIYKILDWKKPWKTVVVVQLCIVFVLVLHLSVCALCLVRCKLAQLWRRGQTDITASRGSNLQGVANEIPINDLLV